MIKQNGKKPMHDAEGFKEKQEKGIFHAILLKLHFGIPNRKVYILSMVYHIW